MIDMTVEPISLERLTSPQLLRLARATGQDRAFNVLRDRAVLFQMLYSDDAHVACVQHHDDVFMLRNAPTIAEAVYAYLGNSALYN